MVAGRRIPIIGSTDGAALESGKFETVSVSCFEEIIILAFETFPVETGNTIFRRVLRSERTVNLIEIGVFGADTDVDPLPASHLWHATACVKP